MQINRPCARKQATGGVSSLSSGFTLIELLVVIAIIAILAGILLPTVSSVRKRIMTSNIKSQIQLIGVGLKSYESDWNVYPPDAQTTGLPLAPAQGEDLFYFLGGGFTISEGYTRNAGPYVAFKLNENAEKISAGTSYPGGGGVPINLQNKKRKYASDGMGNPFHYRSPWADAAAGTPRNANQMRNPLSYDLFSEGVVLTDSTVTLGSFPWTMVGDDITNWDEE